MLPNKFNLRFFWSRYTLVSICMFAVCVSLGAALVSLSKALVLLGFFVSLVLRREEIFAFRFTRVPRVFSWMVAALAWMLLSMSWSQATQVMEWKYFYSHTRFIWLAIIFYQIETKERGLKVLEWLVYGQIAVLSISWLLWLGVEVPYTRRPLEKGIAFTSTLEQPVMTVLVLIALWNFRDYWSKLWGEWFVRLAITAMGLNMIFVMSGRTGYIVFVVIVAYEIQKMLPNRWKWVAFLSPVILSAIFYSVSPVFHKRVAEINSNTEIYFENDSLSAGTSEGQRLDMWKQTTLGILKKPILGYGVGSMPDLYKTEGGLIKNAVSQPHQQYLFWWAEFGLIGLVIMSSLFFVLYKDSNTLDLESKSALLSVIAALFVTGLFNCPFFGVGLGEFFFLEIAALLAIKASASTKLVTHSSR